MSIQTELTRIINAKAAIKAAIERGKLNISRWESYRKLKEEAPRDEMLRRKREWSKGVAKYAKQRKKEIW